jgi:hypothetical protein
LILKQTAYMAGSITSVRIVPAKVPPMSVYASAPQISDAAYGRVYFGSEK